MRGIATKRGRQEGSRERQYHARSRRYNRSYQDERNQVCSRIRRRLVEAPQDVNAIITVKKWTTNAVAQYSMLQLLLKDEAKAVQYVRQPRRYTCRQRHGMPIAHD